MKCAEHAVDVGMGDQDVDRLGNAAHRPDRDPGVVDGDRAVGVAAVERVQGPFQPWPQRRRSGRPVGGQPVGQVADLDLVVDLGERDPVVQVVLGQEVDQVGQRDRPGPRPGPPGRSRISASHQAGVGGERRSSAGTPRRTR